MNPTDSWENIRIAYRQDPQRIRIAPWGIDAFWYDGVNRHATLYMTGVPLGTGAERTTLEDINALADASKVLRNLTGDGWSVLSAEASRLDRMGSDRWRLPATRRQAKEELAKLEELLHEGRQIPAQSASYKLAEALVRTKLEGGALQRPISSVTVNIGGEKHDLRPSEIVLAAREYVHMAEAAGYRVDPRRIDGHLGPLTERAYRRTMGRDLPPLERHVA